MDKLSDAINCGKVKTMENINRWKLIFEFNAIDFNKNTPKPVYADYLNLQELYEKMGRSLLLIQSQYRIYGLFMIRQKIHDLLRNEWCFSTSDSFAFDCGPNSAHMSANIDDDDLQ